MEIGKRVNFEYESIKNGRVKESGIVLDIMDDHGMGHYLVRMDNKERIQKWISDSDLLPNPVLDTNQKVEIFSKAIADGFGWIAFDSIHDQWMTMFGEYLEFSECNTIAKHLQASEVPVIRDESVADFKRWNNQENHECRNI
jgi:hypothetical protein